MSTPRESYDAPSPTGKPAAGAAHGEAWPAVGYPLVWRIFAGALLVASGTAVPVLLLLALRADDPPLTPLVLVELFATTIALPAAAARLVRMALSCEAACDASGLRVSRPGRTLELPRNEIARVSAWLVPLPGAGIGVRLRSGGRLHLALRDPTPLLRALASAGVAGAEAAAARATPVWAAARAAHRRRLAAHPVVKFAAFALLPAGVLFYTHQHIAYGGWLGEYHLLGAKAWLRTLASYWGGTCVYLVLYAGVLRAPAEALAWLAARVAPPAAPGARRAVEIVCQLAYYGGVPVLLALRYLA
jgi:apolipoprotein N-acyltransferase